MIVSFTSILLLIIGIGSFTFWVIHENNKTSEEIKNIDLPLLISNTQLESSLANRIGAIRGYLLSGDSFYKDLFDSYTEDTTPYIELVLDIGDTETYEPLIAQMEEWETFIIDEVFGEYDRGNEEGAIDNLLKANDDFTALISEHQDMAQASERAIMQKEEDVVIQGQKTLTISLIVICLVIVFGVLIAIFISRSIAQPIRQVRNRMQLITSGDLSHPPLETNLRDEIGELIHAANDMSDTTRDLLNEIHTISNTVTEQSHELDHATNEVREGSEQIASTMQELASGSESQANRSGELLSAMQSFTHDIKDAHERGENIQTSSTHVLTMTEEGRQLMESTKEQMLTIDKIVSKAVEKVQGLETHSQEISKLVGVIQDIAEQTNLLALNAAIEAARAGEHGQGFAIVADEVRKLAEEVSYSVSDITEIVTNIQQESSVVTDSLQAGYQEVLEGSHQIESTDEKFADINTAVLSMVDHINTSAENLSHIATNSRDMNQSIEEIAAVSEQSAAGVEQTSAATQQTNASMEELADSSTDLAQLADNLNELVHQFKLSER